MVNINKLKKLINEADAIIIGAGAGLSAAAGLDYSGPKFEHDFDKYIKKYGFTDLYTSAFYHFEKKKEKWAYWAKHIYYTYYEQPERELYQKLLKLVENKKYFVITTNTDGLFINNGFKKDKVFEVQGSYAKLQCSKPCHQKLYNNKKRVYKWLENINEQLEIPHYLIPTCPVCGREMSVNLRSDNFFVEDSNWHKQSNAYEDFLKNKKDKKVVLLEFGVGFNTPGIIRFPFEQYTFMYDTFYLIRFNDKYPMVPDEIKDRSMSINDDISEVIDLLLKI